VEARPKSKKGDAGDAAQPLKGRLILNVGRRDWRGCGKSRWEGKKHTSGAEARANL